MTTPPAAPPPLDSYEFERLQRKDLLGETWRALDCKRGRKADLRLLPEWVDRVQLERFIAQIGVATISHPGLISTYGLIAEGDRMAVLLETSGGETILQRRSRRPRRHFEVSEIKPWLRSILDVLTYLHSQQLPHGAIYGGSILVEGASLSLTDLAVSRLLRPQARFDGASALPMAVMSPQVLAGADPALADDLYGLGALAYDLLTGAALFSSGDIATQVNSTVPCSVRERRAQLEVQSAPVPQAWEDWLAASLAKEPTRRPSLEELGELLRSGSFREAGTAGVSQAAKTSARPSAAVVPAPQETPAPAAPAPVPAGPQKPSVFSRLSVNHWIMVGAGTAALLLFLGVYFLKIAPRSDFKCSLDAAYVQVITFDEDTVGDHAAVIAKWEKFHKDWQVRVTTEYPEFQPVLNSGKEQRLARLKLQDEEKEREKAEAAERKNVYLTKARAEYDVAEAKAASMSDNREIAVDVWTAFLTNYDVDFEGERPAELARQIAQAKANRDALKGTLEDEKKVVNESLVKTDAELAKLYLLLGDANAGAGYKIGLVEAFLTGLNAVPRVAMAHPQMQEMRKKAEMLLPELRLKAEAETPKTALDLKALFADSPAKDFSDNGRKRLLSEVQALLKEQTLYTGEADGSTGQGTHDALIAYQKSKNLVTSAALDSRTLTSLGLVDLKDDLTPMAAAQTTVRRSSSRSRSKPEEEEKGFFNKVGDGAKNVGKSIGGMFGGSSKDKEKDKKKKK